MNVRHLTFAILLTAVVFFATGCAQTQEQPSRKYHAGRHGGNKAADFSPRTTSPETPSNEQLKDQVNQLLKQLASEEYRQREQATSKIKKVIEETPEVIDLLLSELKDTQEPEIKERLESVLAPFEKWGLSGAVLRQFPDIREKLERQDRKVLEKIAEELGDKKPDGASGPLIRLLAHQHSKVTSAAEKALEDLGQCAVKPLIEAFRSANEDVPSRAIYAIARIGKPAVEPLLESLENTDEFVRRCAVCALGAIGDKSAVEPLIAVMRNGTGQVRCDAANALGDIGGIQATRVLVKVLKEGKDNSVRYSAAEALGTMCDSAVVEPLIEAMTDDSAGVRAMAAEALGRIGDKRAVGPLIQALQRKDSWSGVAAIALGEIGDERAVGPLIGMLKSEDLLDRLRAVRALKKIGYTKVIEPLIELLATEEESAIRFEAAEILAETGDKNAVEPLRRLWNGDSDRQVRTAAAYGLVKLAGDNEAFMYLAGAMVDIDLDNRWQVRRTAARALGKLRDKRATELLVAALRKEDEHSLTRPYAAEALGDIGDERAVETLREIWNKDKNKEVRLRVAYALAKITADAGALEFLIESLKDRECWVPRVAAEYLARIGGSMAIEALIDALKDDYRDVRELAVAALKEVSGQDFGSDYGKWKEWYESNRKENEK